jgi:hypothetical protein
MFFNTVFMRGYNLEAQEDQKEPPLPYYLIADYLVHPDGPLPGTGSCTVVRLIPPREAVSDLAHLETFYSTLATLIAQVAGTPRFAGGRINSGRTTKRQVKQRLRRRSFLSEFEKEAEAEIEEAEIELPAAIHPATLARQKRLAKRYHLKWENGVSLEIAGGYRQVSFLLRLADPDLLHPIVQMLRLEYPHLGVERLQSSAGPNFRRDQPNLRSNPSNFRSGNPGHASSSPSIPEGSGCDPLALADDLSGQRSACQWLLLSEHPVMPLDLPGQASSRRRSTRGGGDSNQLKASPLRQLIGSLSELASGEIASSQLYIYGPVAKEWIKAQETHWEKARATESERTSATAGRSSGSGGNRSSVGQGRSSRSSQSSSGANIDRYFLPVMLVAVIAIIIYFGSRYIKINRLSPEVVPLLTAVGLAALLLCLMAGLMVWWPFRSRRQKGEILDLQGMEDKFGSPPVLAAIRQVVSVPFEDHLQEICYLTRYKENLARQGYSQSRAACLFQLRQQWLKAYSGHGTTSEQPKMTSPSYKGANGTDASSGATPFTGPVLSPDLTGKLVQIDNAEDMALWEWVTGLAEAEAEERCDQLLKQLAAGYAGFNSSTWNAFTVAPAELEVTQSYSTLHPYDWPGPERFKRAGLESLWPLNSPLFDWLEKIGNKELPAEASEHRGLQVLSALELSYLWHLPGGYEQLDFVERTGPKVLGPDPYLLRGSTPLVKPPDRPAPEENAGSRRGGTGRPPEDEEPDRPGQSDESDEFFGLYYDEF